EAEGHRESILEELDRRRQLSDGDARYEYMKLRQRYMWIFDDEDGDWYYFERTIEDCNEEMKKAQGTEEQLIIMDKILDELDNQMRSVRRLEEGESLNLMRERFLNAELGTEVELLSRFSEMPQDFRPDGENEAKEKNDGDNSDNGDNGDNGGNEDIEDSDGVETFSKSKR